MFYINSFVDLNPQRAGLNLPARDAHGSQSWESSCPMQRTSISRVRRDSLQEMQRRIKDVLKAHPTKRNGRRETRRRRGLSREWITGGAGLTAPRDAHLSSDFFVPEKRRLVPAVHEPRATRKRVEKKCGASRGCGRPLHRTGHAVGAQNRRTRSTSRADHSVCIRVMCKWVDEPLLVVATVAKNTIYPGIGIIGIDT